jgi:hypothetical protein
MVMPVSRRDSRKGMIGVLVIPLRYLKKDGFLA